MGEDGSQSVSAEAERWRGGSLKVEGCSLKVERVKIKS
jgi:hypothetical protein